MKNKYLLKTKKIIKVFKTIPKSILWLMLVGILAFLMVVNFKKTNPAKETPTKQKQTITPTNSPRYKLNYRLDGEESENITFLILDLETQEEKDVLTLKKENIDLVLSNKNLSPNGKYLILMHSFYTDELHYNIIYNSSIVLYDLLSKQNKIIAKSTSKYSFIRPVWNLDSNKFLYMRLNKDLMGKTSRFTDLMVYDLESQTSKELLVNERTFAGIVRWVDSLTIQFYDDRGSRKTYTMDINTKEIIDIGPRTEVPPGVF